ncbi:MAG: hypothetical protein R6V43_09865 [Halopseudomonas sp.]
MRKATKNACEPAMSLVPNFMITGILAMLLSLALIVSRPSSPSSAAWRGRSLTVPCQDSPPV